MAQTEGLRRAPVSAGDLAYGVLREQNRPLHFRELCQEIAARRGLDPESPFSLARVYTDLNLDHRLVYLGEGRWGLREWHQQRVTRSVSGQIFRPVRKEPPWREEVEQTFEEGEPEVEEEEEEEDEEAGWDAPEEESI